MQVSILGLLANDSAQSLMGCHGYHAILCYPNRFIFRDNKNIWYLAVPLNNVASMSNSPSVQGKSNKPPPHPEVCVCAGDSYSLILPLFLVS